MTPYRIARLARADLREIYSYIASDNPTAAARVLERFYSTFLLLAKEPLIGEVREDLGDGLRGFVSGNYLIVYRPSGRQIQIARVIHAARDIKTVFPSN
jgi:toxin ParE1/3/4